MLWLDWRWSVELSGSGGHLGGKNILFKEVLIDKFFQVPSEVSAKSSIVSLVAVKGLILICSGEGRIVLD